MLESSEESFFIVYRHYVRLNTGLMKCLDGYLAVDVEVDKGKNRLDLIANNNGRYAISRYNGGATICTTRKMKGAKFKTGRLKSYIVQEDRLSLFYDGRVK